MIYGSAREAHDKELRGYGFTREESQNIYSKIGDFYVILYTDEELAAMRETDNG